MSIQTFEHPLNELTRLSLRVEYLFAKIDDNLKHKSSPHLGQALKQIINITHLLDRPDLKSKYAKALQSQLEYLKRLGDQSGVDRHILSSTISELEELFNFYNQARNKIAQPLRENEFLNNIRQHLLYPGGDADFELPALQSWLNCPASVTVPQIDEWLAELKIVRDTVDLLLKLIRHKGNAVDVLATQGFHQELLDGNNQFQLVRIKVDQSPNVYPIISAGKHRLMIRFYEATHLQSEEQALRDIPFKLICCS